MTALLIAGVILAAAAVCCFLLSLPSWRAWEREWQQLEAFRAMRDSLRRQGSW